VDFHDGITAIVGPNGCGKSNISDAIRWVMGEQRPTAIRGAKMEEAIFQGTVNRRPVNRGSVSLTVTNEDGTLPVPFEEVEIGRQVFRDGGSEYTINRSAVRLRDVVDLYRDTGLGANAYAMIENRMIDAILSDRAAERRGLFEEAAGIGKYKDRRKAAVRRLERAEMDLQRLEDVISEVQSKVRSLARQKGKAQRYTEYRARRLDVEVAVVRHQLDTLRTRLEGVQKGLEGDQQTARGMVAELSAAEAEYETLRLREVDAEKDRTAAAKVLDGIRDELVRWERDLAVADERSTYAARRLGQIQEERTQEQERAQGFGREAEELRAARELADRELGERSANGWRRPTRHWKASRPRQGRSLDAGLSSKATRKRPTPRRRSSGVAWARRRQSSPRRRTRSRTSSRRAISSRASWTTSPTRSLRPVRGSRTPPRPWMGPGPSTSRPAGASVNGPIGRRRSRLGVRRWRAWTGIAKGSSPWFGLRWNTRIPACLVCFRTS
jgi:chromosome segregation protein